jgi:hypothetical protein
MRVTVSALALSAAVVKKTRYSWSAGAQLASVVKKF